MHTSSLRSKARPRKAEVPMREVSMVESQRRSAPPGHVYSPTESPLFLVLNYSTLYVK